ncbi:uncharacterized protein JCM6883_003558 [Sporobolomyces salmoneus]|uniref:uncharacterized protein n=1 Tax=Sporobolomyces salmoneus TaxID=183962 RepID=UPI0031814973
MADPTHVEWVELLPVYSGGMIFLSWAVSVVGAWTTLEILLRRTGNAGMMNVLLLLGAGIAFGSTATFGMHFVGNQALTLKLPPPWEGQGVPLSYSPSYTILSLIISCLCMILAFSFIGLRFNAPVAKVPREDDELEPVDSLEEGDKFEDEAPEERKIRPTTAQTDKTTLSSISFMAKNRSVWESSAKEKQREDEAGEDDEEAREERGEFGVHSATVSKAGVAKILGAGVICGGGIAAMHYVGQCPVNSVPRITNDWYTIFASILIAMAAVSLGLYILFVVFRPKLQHSWYKRLAVAMLLGAGVTCMHFVALVGTHYFAREGTDLTTPADNATKKIIISIICVVAPICCISLVIFAWFAQLRHARQRAARHRIILSTAIFDHQGLLLVQPESGLLPSARIYPSSTSEDKPSFLSSFGIGNQLRLDSNRVKLSRSDPSFVAFVQESWRWRNRQSANKSSNNEKQGLPTDGDETNAEGGEAGAGRNPKGIDTNESEMLRRSLVSFQMASEDIATQIGGSGEDLRCLGVLYDSILKTGHYQVSSKTTNDKFTVTQGQMLVLARRLKNAAERDSLLAKGFVFAEPGAVARLTSNALACPYDRVFDYFRDAYRFTRFGLSKKLERGRLYGGLLLLQALPGAGLQVVVDEKMHHSLPMTEVALLVDSSIDRSKFPASALPVTTLESVVQGLESLGGRSLEELSNYSAQSTSPQDAAGQLQFLVANVVRPYFNRVFSETTISSLADRLILTSSVVPLSSRSGPSHGADGIVKDSYFLCIKAIVPSSFPVPGRPLNWLPFQLYRAQSESVAQLSASSAARPGTGVSIASTIIPYDVKSHGSSSGGHERGDDDLPFPLSTASPFSSSAFPPSGSTKPFPSAPFPRNRLTPPSTAQSTSTLRHSFVERDLGIDESPSRRPLSGVPPYSADWVMELVKETVAGQEQSWRAWDVPGRRPARSRTTSNNALDRV